MNERMKQNTKEKVKLSLIPAGIGKNQSIPIDVSGDPGHINHSKSGLMFRRH